MTTSTASKMSLAGHKAWATRRANQASKAAVKATVKTVKATATNDRSLSLAGTRKLRASAATLVGRLQDAKSIEYYYGANRSVIVLNN
jgi:hypothetical protein